jgi:hypothetical protein
MALINGFIEKFKRQKKHSLSYLPKQANKQIKQMDWGWVLPGKQNQIAVVGRISASPPLIANSWASNE